MPQNKQEKIKKLLTFNENENLALLDELSEINETLKDIKDKESPEAPEFPITDLTETNKKLDEMIQAIKEKDREKEDISISLELQ